MAVQFRSYEVARKTFSFLEFIGWAVVAISVLLSLSLAGSAGGYMSGTQVLMMLMPGISGALLGLFLVGAVQYWRAGVDSAEYGQQILQIARDQLAVSKQALNQQATTAQSFAQLAEGSDGSSASVATHRTTISSTNKTTGLPDRHRGHNIYRVGSSYKSLGRVFASHEAALAAIDQKLGPVPSLSANSASSEENSVIPVDPSRVLSFEGHDIVIEKGKYHVNGIPFGTQKQAENYIRNFASTPAPKLEKAGSDEAE